MVKVKRLYIRNLDELATADQIKGLFSIYGDVKRVHVRKNRGIGFVDMMSTPEALRAIHSLNGKILWGRTLRINALDNTIRHRLFFVRHLIL